MIYQESETVEWKSAVVDDITALQSQIPRRKQRGIKLEMPQGSGDLVYAPLRSVLFAKVFTRVKAKMWQKIDGYTKMR